MHFSSVVLLLYLLSAPFQSPQDKLRQHYEAAQAHSRAGRLAEAETEYSAVLGEGYGKLGRIYSVEKKYSEAISTLEGASRYQPDSQEVLIDLAIAYFDAEQFNRAFDPLLKVLAHDPQSATAHHLLGKTHFMLGQFEKAGSELQTALKLAPNDYDVAYTLGLAYLKQGEPAPARQIFDRMLKELGERPALHIVFGRAFRETEFLAEAIDEFKKAVALDPKFPRAHYYLGLTYLLKDGTPRVGDAEVEFKFELNANPDEFLANYFLGLVYLVQREWEPAINFLEKAARLQPQNPDPYFRLSEAYQATAKHDRAVEVLRKSIALTPDLAHNDYQVTTAHYRLGQSLLKAGQTEEGEKEIQIASELKSKGFKSDEEKFAAIRNPARSQESGGKLSKTFTPAGIIAEANKPDEKTLVELKSEEAYYSKVVASAHQNIGLLRADRQDFPSAAEQFGLAAKWNPQLEHINFNWGLAAFKADLYKQAIPPLERELTANPANTAARQLLGMSFFATQDYSKAADLLAAVVALKPNEAALYYPLAFSLMRQGKTVEAENIIQQMISRGGNSAEVHILLGQAYQQRGDLAKALEELRTAWTLDDKIPLAHYYSGLIYLKMGNLDEAAREFETELVVSPHDAEVKYHLAFALLASQKLERGIALLRGVIQAKPDYAEARYELGKALLQQGDLRGAVDSLEIAARLKPDEPYVHYQLGRAYLAAAREAEGKSQLEMFKRLKDKASNGPHH